jgi:hypothetical protein
VKFDLDDARRFQMVNDDLPSVTKNQYNAGTACPERGRPVRRSATLPPGTLGDLVQRRWHTTTRSRINVD